jgi:hypothetical protein
VFPDCAADSVQVPAFNMVIVMPDTVHTVLVVEAMVTESPDVAVGETSKVVADQGRSLMAVNEIVCDA